MYEWSDARYSLPEPRTDLGADFDDIVIFYPEAVLPRNAANLSSFFFLFKVRSSSLPSCEGDFVSSCYNDEKLANGAYAGALFVEYGSIGHFTSKMKVRAHSRFLKNKDRNVRHTNKLLRELSNAV